MALNGGGRPASTFSGGWLVAGSTRSSRGAEPADAWRQVDFNDADWESGPSGFGYGDADDATVLDDMEDNYLTVYIRKTFSVSSLTDALVQLAIDYDDGFVAYLNGTEVARRHVSDPEPTYETTASSHEAGTPELIPLGRAGDLFSVGVNVLAVEEPGPALFGVFLRWQQVWRGECHDENRNKHARDSMGRFHTFLLEAEVLPTRWDTAESH